MFGLLALLFVVVPIAELYVIVQVAQGLGIAATIALVMLVSAAGAWLCKREGVGLYRRIQAELTAGQVPTATLVDGFLVLFAGALLLTPGFLTDVFGLALLLQPVRVVVRTVLLRRFARRARRAVADNLAGRFGPGRGPGIFVGDPRRASQPSGSPIIDVQEAVQKPHRAPPEAGPPSSQA